MKTSKKLIFFGTEDFSLPSLKRLLEAGFPIAAVVTKPDSARGRSKELVAPAVKTFALNNNITVYQPKKLHDIEPELRTIDAAAGVLVSYGKLLPQSTLDLFGDIGIINVHPSLLPKYRGPAPIEAAILHGDSELGISIMQLTAGMDEGPIFAQQSYPLTGTETKPELAEFAAEAGAKLLVSTLPNILENNVHPIPQQKNDVSYTSLLSKSDGILEPTTENSTTLERKVRAYLGFPKTRLILDGNDVVVTSVKVVESLSSAPLVISCANNTYLALTELIAPSGKTMTAEAYIRGYRS